MHDLSVIWSSGISASHAGLYVCPGKGAHATFQLPTWELILVRSGQLRMWEGQRSFAISPGQTLLLRPGQRHGGIGAYPADLSFYWLHFHADEAARGAAPSRNIPQVATPARPQRVQELWHRFMNDFTQPVHGDPAADLLVVQILLEVVHEMRTQHAKRPSVLAQRITAFIDTNFHRPITAASVARSLHRSVNYLGHAYGSATGMTITGYLMRRRIQEARLLLVTTDEPLQEVARQCGFSHAAYFSRVFHALQGVSPSSYRAMHAATTINAR